MLRVAGRHDAAGLELRGRVRLEVHELVEHHAVAPEALSQPHEVRHGRVHLWDAATKTMTGTMEASDASGQHSQMKSVVEYRDAGTRVFTMYMTV